MNAIHVKTNVEIKKVEIDLMSSTVTAHANALLNGDNYPFNRHEFLCRMPLMKALKNYVIENVETYMTSNIPNGDMISQDEMNIIKKLRNGEPILQSDIDYLNTNTNK